MWWGDTYGEMIHVMGGPWGRGGPYGGESHIVEWAMCGEVHGRGSSCAGKAHGLGWSFAYTLSDS